MPVVVGRTMAAAWPVHLSSSSESGKEAAMVLSPMQLIQVSLPMRPALVQLPMWPALLLHMGSAQGSTPMVLVLALVLVLVLEVPVSMPVVLVRLGAAVMLDSAGCW